MVVVAAVVVVVLIDVGATGDLLELAIVQWRQDAYAEEIGDPGLLLLFGHGSP